MYLMIPQTNHQWLLVLQIEQGVSDFFFIAYVHFVYQLIGTASGFLAHLTQRVM
jgi:hypothetical protein